MNHFANVIKPKHSGTGGKAVPAADFQNRFNRHLRIGDKGDI